MVEQQQAAGSSERGNRGGHREMGQGRLGLTENKGASDESHISVNFLPVLPSAITGPQVVPDREPAPEGHRGRDEPRGYGPGYGPGCGRVNQGPGRRRGLLGQDEEETEDQADIGGPDIDLLHEDLNLDPEEIHQGDKRP